MYGTALSKDIVLSDVRLESKSGGVNSGDYVRGGVGAGRRERRSAYCTVVVDRAEARARASCASAASFVGC